MGNEGHSYSQMNQHEVELSSPSAPPAHGPGVVVEFRDSVDVRHFSDSEQPPMISEVKDPIFLPVVKLRTHLTILRWVGLLMCLIQMAGVIAIPVATYITVVKSDDRYAIEDYVHWGIALVAGAWGMVALGSMRSLALAIHIVLGAMFAAALGAHNTALYGDLENRCATNQIAFKGCLDCPCAAINACSADDVADPNSCPGCMAPTTDFCNNFNMSHNKILLAVTGPVTVFLMAIPIIFSLLALLKVETANGLLISNRVAHALAMINQQLIHLNAHEGLRVPLDELMDSIHLIEREGGPAMLRLADQARTALNRNGFNIVPRGYETKESIRPTRGTSVNVMASPPSIAASRHSMHSVAGSQYSRTQHHYADSPSGEQDQWRSPSATDMRSLPPSPPIHNFNAMGKSMAPHNSDPYYKA